MTWLLSLVLSLAVSPAHAFAPWAEFTYTVQATAPSNALLCTGWRRVLEGVPEDLWPFRRSCRLLGSRSYVMETWGGPRYPLAPGRYVAFAELRLSSGSRLATKPFLVLASARYSE